MPQRARLSRPLKVLACILILAATSLIAAEQTSQIRIELKDKQQLLQVRQMHLDVIHAAGNQLEAFVSPEELSNLDRLGIEYQVVHADVVEHYVSRLDPSRDMGGYRTLSEIYLAMDSIANENPAIVSQRDSIGHTIEGRAIYVMKISDNVGIDEVDEEEVYYNAAIHAREVITPEVLIYYMRHLTDNYGFDPEATYLVNNRELFFTCVNNPDGYYHNEVTDPFGGGLWRKNRRDNGDGTYGVDLNRNFGYEWGFDNSGSSPFPGDADYRGTAGFSEPETQGLRDFITSRDFTVTVSYHSYSNLFIYPWGYDQIYTPEHELFVAMGDSVSSFNGYSPGTAWELLYPVNGSTDDWGYGEQTTKNKNYAVTLEVGNQDDGFWPATSRIPTLVEENLEPNLFFARVAENVQQLRPPYPPNIYPVGLVETDTFSLFWRHDDLENPAVSFEVWQLSDFSAGLDDAESPAAASWNFDGFEISNQYSFSGLKSYHSNSGDNLDTRMTTAFPYQVQPGDSLKFMARWDIETDWDYGYVEVSTDNGLNWSSIPGNITTTSDPHGNNLGNGITGVSSWTEAKFDLSVFLNKSILLRFRYVTDGFVTDPGLWIDDVDPVAGFGSIAMLNSSVTDTTYLVENLTDGIYNFRVRATDAQSQESQFSALEEVEVSLPPACTWLVGDANADGMYSVADAVYVITYIFGGGPAAVPDPVGSADADCNGTASIADAVYMIQYIFGAGPAPGQPCDCASYL